MFEVYTFVISSRGCMYMSVVTRVQYFICVMSSAMDGPLKVFACHETIQISHV